MGNTLTSILERMDQILKPQRALQEQMDRILEPQRRLQEQMNKFLEPQLRLQEQMDKYLEPHRKLQEQMQRYLKPQHQLQEHMKTYLAPQHRIQEQLEKYLEPQRLLQAQMDKYLEPHRRLQEQFEKYLEPQRLIQNQINKYLEPLNHYLSDSMMDIVSIGSDGLLSVSGEIVDVESVNRSIKNISEDYSSSEEFLNNFFQWLEKLSSAARIAVLYLVLPYFLAIVANITTPIYEEWWVEYADIDHRVAKKAIIREANEIYSPEDLVGYRFVYVAILHVRDSGNMSAEIIDELYLGKAIKVVEKLKRWSLVEYQDSETSETKQGWVFSRYLEKFKK